MSTTSVTPSRNATFAAIWNVTAIDTMGLVRKPLLGVLLAAAVISCGGNTTPPNHGLDPACTALIDSVIASGIAQGNYPGAVVAVVRDSSMAFLKAYGNRQTVPSAAPMTEETIFDLASLSKPLGTTLALMQLVERGKIRIMDRVDSYIPGFVPWTDGKETVNITVQDLLTHSSGLPPYTEPEPFAGNPDALLQHIALECPRQFRPRTRAHYSCLNFIVLQHIIEMVSGQRLCDYLRHNVFDVLGLEHTCYNPQGALAGNCAATEVGPDGLPLVATVHDPLARIVGGGNSGNAGMFSSAGDLCIMAAAIMNGGQIGGKRILGRETVRRMLEIPSDNAPEVARALGWDTYAMYPGTSGDLFDRRFTVGHTGYTGTSIVIDMSTRTAVIILANRVHPSDTGSMARTRGTIANIVAGAIR